MTDDSDGIMHHYPKIAPLQKCTQPYAIAINYNYIYNYCKLDSVSVSLYILWDKCWCRKHPYMFYGISVGAESTLIYSMG